MNHISQPAIEAEMIMQTASRVRGLGDAAPGRANGPLRGDGCQTKTVSVGKVFDSGGALRRTANWLQIWREMSAAASASACEA